MLCLNIILWEQTNRAWFLLIVVSVSNLLIFHTVRKSDEFILFLSKDGLITKDINLLKYQHDSRFYPNEMMSWK